MVLWERDVVSVDESTCILEAHGAVLDYEGLLLVVGSFRTHGSKSRKLLGRPLIK